MSPHFLLSYLALCISVNAENTAMDTPLEVLEQRPLSSFTAREIGQLVEAAFLSDSKMSESEDLAIDSLHERAAMAREALIAAEVDGETLQEIVQHKGGALEQAFLSELYGIPVGFRRKVLRQMKNIVEKAKEMLVLEDSAETCRGLQCLTATRNVTTPSPAPRRLNIAWTCPPGNFTVGCPPAGLKLEERRKILHEALLDGYDFNIAPYPVTVRQHINFFKPVNLDLKSSQMELAVWFRLLWTDSRLTWNASAWGINYTTLQAESFSLENSLVWLPDVELYNNAEGLSSSLLLKPAILSADGNMFWSRPGIIKALCRFWGLELFPYDELRCDLEFAAWSHDGWLQDIHMLDEGFAWKGNSENAGITAGSSFQDYVFKSFSVERREPTYPPNDIPWPTLVYTVNLKRSSSFYMWKLIIPQICMAILSFVPYFLSPECGERLGFGITLILAILTTDVISMDLQPITDDDLLMDYVTRICFFFCFFSLVETAVVTFFHFLEVEDVWEFLPCVPKIIRCCRCKVGLTSLQEINVDDDEEHGNIGAQDAKAQLMENYRDHEEVDRQAPQKIPGAPGMIPDVDPPPPPGPRPSPLLVVSNSCTERWPTAGLDSKNTCTESGPPAGLDSKSRKRRISAIKKLRAARTTNTLDGAQRVKNLDHRVRMALYQRAFYCLDQDFSGKLNAEEISKFGRFMLADEWSDEKTMEFILAVDENKSGALELREFQDFCEHTVLGEDDMRDKQFVKDMVVGFLETVRYQSEQTNAYWKHVARQIDNVARWFVPPIFVITIIIAVNAPTVKTPAS